GRNCTGGRRSGCKSSSKGSGRGSGPGPGPGRAAEIRSSRRGCLSVGYPHSTITLVGGQSPQRCSGKLRGRLDFGPDFQLALKGWVTYGNPPTLRFQGVGDKNGSKDWVYDYQAYYVLEWPDGIDQRPAIVGSVIRTKPHSDGRAPAGV